MASESSVMAVIRASRPSFRNPHDKVAFAVHASFLAAEFSLIATGSRALSDNPPTDGEEVGIDGWNELEDAYAFVYTKTVKGSKKAVLVKCLPIGDLLAVDVLNLNESQEEPFHLQIKINDYLSDVADRTSNYAQLYKNLKGLIDSLDSGVVSKLEPKIESSSSTRSDARSKRNTSSEPSARVPGQADPYNPGIVYPPIPSSGISDLYPGPGAGFYPQRGPGIDGGMLVGPNDPRFFGSDERAGFLGGLPGVPPGARFDPYGPPGVPGFEPSRFVRYILSLFDKYETYLQGVLLAASASDVIELSRTYF
ncbi:putative proteasome inhibitor [Canna indica]|uniref:Proteasome inhibitor n=1 Tax=Canna indica TaxID=4628 RepID=A0AAQ3JU86_9LILI|nr:putative proteasome inhibitor [Canna indica]